MSRTDRFRLAARAYFAYGVVYYLGGLYLVAHGVGVAAAEAPGAKERAMLKWGLIGLVPLVAIPLLLARRWSVLHGWVSRRAFAWLIAAFLAVRAYKVGLIALAGSGSAAAPWEGVITFQTGAVVFLVVTLAALVFVARAAWAGE